MIMNPGKWIVVAFIFFAAFIATLVTVCMRQKVSLVSKDYYQEELQFEARIEEQQNVIAEDLQPEIRIIGKTLQISFKQGIRIDDAALTLFCPSDDSKDLHYKLNQSNLNVVEIPNGKKRLYLAKFRWTTGEKLFYHEQRILI